MAVRVAPWAPEGIKASRGNFHASATHFVEPHAAWDALVRNYAAILKGVEAKSYCRAVDAVRVLVADEKYSVMARPASNVQTNTP